jgi:hypothetical protein
MINFKNILFLLPFLLVMTTASGAEHPKNIVLILADDLGWADNTLYEKTSLYETPNIQRLAARHDIYQCLSQSNLFADACQRHVWPELCMA